ncbi:hypothetical protein JOD02_000664 [Caldicoprobacter guelmensis]|uniref:hypothetical protein n=1 Tax=Caldicoprobacter guelmensis TaxID=1170224 RepID=UPI001959896F|nr:hypothetical protein [Caldicoprobacter guelmensis]MBM7581827.1 hypothetical protein [Caldicoprobacter guelmensis]
MLDIIIVFIVLSMIIANILKHTGAPKQWPNAEVSGAPVRPRQPKTSTQSRDEGDVYRRPGGRQTQISSIEKENKTYMATERFRTSIDAERVQGFSVDSSFDNSLEGVSQEGLEYTSKDVARENVAAVRLEIISPEVKPHALSFSKHAIINGIIMSELLQPPKALRGRRLY